MVASSLASPEGPDESTALRQLQEVYQVHPSGGDQSLLHPVQFPVELESLHDTHVVVQAELLRRQRTNSPL